MVSTPGRCLTGIGPQAETRSLDIMLRRFARSLIALTHIAAIPAAAWATCAESQPVARNTATCHLAAKGHGRCCPKQSSGELPDCCKVRTPTPQGVFLVAPPASVDRRTATQVVAAAVIDAIMAPAAREVLARADHVPLKFPHGPTYLRISVLLI